MDSSIVPDPLKFKDFFKAFLKGLAKSEGYYREFLHCVFQDRCLKCEHPELDRALPTVIASLERLEYFETGESSRPKTLQFLELKKNEFKLSKINRVQKAAGEIKLFKKMSTYRPTILKQIHFN